MTASAPSDEARAGPTLRPAFLINVQFTRLWVGRTLSVLGDYLFQTTLIVWIATDLGKDQSWSPLAMSGLLAATSLPILLIGPLAGVFVDRWPSKRQIMLRANLISAALMLALFPLIGLNHIPFIQSGAPPLAMMLGAIFLVVFGISAVGQFYQPSASVLIRDIVPEAHRPRAFGLNQISTNFAILVGPPLAAPLLLTFGVGWALLINAASFFASSFMLRSIALSEESIEPQEAQQYPPSVLHDFKAGIQYFFNSRTLVTLSGCIAIVMLGEGALSTLDIFFVTKNLGVPARWYGLMSTAQAIGMIVGSIVWSILAPTIGLRRLVWGGLCGVGALLIVYAHLTHVAPALFVIVGIGFFGPAANIAVGPMILNATSRDFVGRISATINPLLTLASIIGAILGGTLYGTVLSGFQSTILGVSFGPLSGLLTAAGVLCLFGGVAALLLLPHVSEGSIPLQT